MAEWFQLTLSQPGRHEFCFEFAEDKPVKMVCRLWAGNVVVDRQRRLGMTVVEVEMKWREQETCCDPDVDRKQ